MIKFAANRKSNANNKAKNTTKGLPIVDLELIKSSDKPVYKKGDKMFWTIVVINHGPSTAKDVVVSDVMPVGIKFISYKASKGSYDPATGKWDIGELAKGESVVIEMYCEAMATGVITNYANVTSSVKDSNLTNNYDNATITVEEEPEPPEPPKMHPTGNPIIMVLLALLAMVGVTLRRKL